MTSPKNVWLHQIGTSQEDAVYGLAIDQDNNIYITGNTRGDLPGSGNETPGTYDVWLAKYDQHGQQLWVQQMGSAQYDVAWGICLDQNNHAWIAGMTWGAMPGSETAGSTDAWIAKYDAAGNRLFIKQIGSSEEDHAMDICAAPDGGVYVVGYTKGSLPGSDTPLQSAQDAWIGKFDENGEQLWLHQLGADKGSTTIGTAIVADALGEVYIGGATTGQLSSMANKGDKDAWIAKYKPNGTLRWIRQLGTQELDQVNSLATDPFGNLVVTGLTKGNIANEDSALSRKDPDVWIAKYNTLGEQLWIQQLGTTQNDDAWDICTDASGHIYVAGHTGGTFDGSDSNNVQLRPEAWLAKLTPDGQSIWIQQFGSQAGDYAHCIQLDAQENIIVAGNTFGQIGAGNYKGKGDIWIGKFTEERSTVAQEITYYLQPMKDYVALLNKRIHELEEQLAGFSPQEQGASEAANSAINLIAIAKQLTEGNGDGRLSKSDIQTIWEEAMSDGMIDELDQAHFAKIQAEFSLTKPASDWLKKQLAEIG